MAAAIRECGFEELSPSFPRYSPDLAPYYFHVFPKLKNHIKAFTHFSSDEEPKLCTKHGTWAENMPEFSSIEQLRKRYENCIEVRENYIVKQSSIFYASMQEYIRLKTYGTPLIINPIDLK